MSNSEESLEDKLEEKLEELVEPVRGPRRRQHWLLFTFVAVVGLPGALASFGIGLAGLIAFIRSPENLTLFGLGLSLMLLFFSIAVSWFTLEGIRKPDMVILSASLVGALLTWPAFTFGGFLLSYLATNPG